MKKIISIICVAIAIVSIDSCNKKHDPYSPAEFTGELTDGGENNVVSLGLSTWWCTANVEATAPQQMGGLYKWGDLINARTKAVPEMEADVVTQKLGPNYRTPTKNELNELCTSCIWQYVKYKGQLGYVITGKNGNTIFLPFTNGSIASKDICGNYWSREAAEGTTVMVMFFDHEGHYVEPASFGENTYMAVRGVYGGSLQ